MSIREALDTPAGITRYEWFLVLTVLTLHGLYIFMDAFGLSFGFTIGQGAEE